jgi:hypothetical protein
VAATQLGGGHFLWPKFWNQYDKTTGILNDLRTYWVTEAGTEGINKGDFAASGYNYIIRSKGNEMTEKINKGGDVHWISKRLGVDKNHLVPGCHFFEDDDPRMREVTLKWGEKVWVIGWDERDFAGDLEWVVVYEEDGSVCSVHPEAIIEAKVVPIENDISQDWIIRIVDQLIQEAETNPDQNPQYTAGWLGALKKLKMILE